MAPPSKKNSRQNDYLRDYTFSFDSKAKQTEELPNYQLEVKLSLRGKINVRELENHLQSECIFSAEILSDPQARIITVTGIPPDHNFTHNDVLQAVQKFDSNATIDSFRQID